MEESLPQLILPIKLERSSERLTSLGGLAVLEDLGRPDAITINIFEKGTMGRAQIQLPGMQHLRLDHKVSSFVVWFTKGMSGIGPLRGVLHAGSRIAVAAVGDQEIKPPLSMLATRLLVC